MNRFIKLFATELRGCVVHVSVPTLFYLFIYLMVWLLNSFVIGTVCYPAERWDYFRILTFIFCVTLPATIYGYVSEPGKGVFYLLLPASIAEKYLVMLFNCVFLIPASYVLLQMALDSLLVLPGGGDWGYVEVLSARVFEGGGFCLHLVFCTSFFVVGNLLFSGHRTVKTFAMLMAVFIVWRAVKRALLSICAAEGILTEGAVCIGTLTLWIWGYFKLKTLEVR